MRVFTCALFSLSLAAELFGSGIPLDEAVKKKVDAVSLENCGPGAEVRLEPGESKNGVVSEMLIIDFTDLALEGQAIPVKKSCIVSSRVKVKAGSKLRINSGSVIGYSDLSATNYNVQGEASFSYSLPVAGDYSAATSSFSGGSLSDINLLANLANPRFTPCRNEEQIVELRGHILLGLPGNLNSSNALRITGGTQNMGAAWNWGWSDCFKGNFDSQYTAYDGATYQATFSLNGPNTSYVSSGGFTGQLLEMKRSDRIVTGKWSAGSNQGYVEFRITDFSTGAFTGEWGELDNQGKRIFKGTWNGQRQADQGKVSVYALSTAWQGQSKVLSAPDGDSILLAQQEYAARQRWTIEGINDSYVRIINDERKQCIDINTSNNQPRLAACGNYSGQYWKLVPIQDSLHYKLQSLLNGDSLCLDVINDGQNNRLQMTGCSSASGQSWSPQNLQ